MNVQGLIDTAQTPLGNTKGLLAINENTALTPKKQFASWGGGLSERGETRCADREPIVTVPALAQHTTDIIFSDEMVRQQMKSGTPFVNAIADAGSMPRIKVASGADATRHCREKITDLGRFHLLLDVIDPVPELAHAPAGGGGIWLAGQRPLTRVCRRDCGEGNPQIQEWAWPGD
jgi:hypothetical protein